VSSSANIQIKHFIFSLILFAVFLLSGCSSQTQQITADQPKVNEADQPAVESKEETKEPIKSELCEVVNVVDGDTIKVNINGATETLRLIGIDTPETVDPRKPVQCFGKEASNKAKEILTGKKVRLEADSTQDERDKYNRLLRYVYLEDGTFFNKLMIEEGYAHEYTYQSNPYKYQTEFKEAEKNARESKKGLWGDLCGGDTTKSVENKTEEKVVDPVPNPVPSSVAYSCNCSKTCDQMGCPEAQYQLNSCGCSRRDADKDGIACDTQCQ
jgi:micrococcal nuclease